MATVCCCSLAVDVFTAGVAHNKTRDYFSSVLVSCLLRFRALLLTAFACCHAMPCSKPGCQTASSTARSKHNWYEELAASAVD